jgi:hypothetical protein
MPWSHLCAECSDGAATWAFSSEAEKSKVQRRWALLTSSLLERMSVTLTQEKPTTLPHAQRPACRKQNRFRKVRQVRTTHPCGSRRKSWRLRGWLNKSYTSRSGQTLEPRSNLSSLFRRACPSFLRNSAKSQHDLHVPRRHILLVQISKMYRRSKVREIFVLGGVNSKF